MFVYDCYDLKAANVLCLSNLKILFLNNLEKIKETNLALCTVVWSFHVPPAQIIGVDKAVATLVVQLKQHSGIVENFALLSEENS